MQYLSWEDVFDLGGTPVTASSTSLVILNSDGTQTRILGTGLTYTNNQLSGGTLTGMERYDPSNSTVLVSLTGGSKPVSEVLAELQIIGEVQADLAALASFFDIENADEPSSFTQTFIEFVDTDGHQLQFIGTNFGTDLNYPDFANGLVTEIRVLDGNGATLETSGAVSYNLGTVARGFDGSYGFLINLAKEVSTNIFVDDTYSADDTYFDVSLGSAAKAFDLNSDGFFSVYYETNGVVADLAAGTVLRDGVTDTFTGTPTGYGFFDGSSGDDTITTGGNVFKGVSGSYGNDTITGSAAADFIFGGRGNDKIYGGQGNDGIYGDDGNDYVRVGGGAEYFDGGDGTDYISYYDSTNGITANLGANTISGSWAVNDSINSFEGISGSRTGDDVITGSSGANIIRTYGGNDKVYAGGGTDTVELGSGNDYVRVGGGAESFDGGSGTDYISYYDSTNGITIDLAADTVSGSWAVNDAIQDFEGASGSSTGNDKMYGTSGANTLKGFGGDDKLYGRSGNDKLYGGDGKDRFDGGNGTDRLFGGSGEDTFHLDFGEGHDIVEDFENNVDKIQLDNFAFGSGQDAFDFANQIGNDVVFDFGNGDGLTVLDTTTAQLSNDLFMV